MTDVALLGTRKKRWMMRMVNSAIATIGFAGTGD
jgi:hypothetical protein